MSLNTLLLRIDEIDNRYKFLTKLSDALCDLGFYPLPIDSADLDCYWVRLATKDNKELPISPEVFDDMQSLPDLIKAIKQIALHKEDN